MESPIIWRGIERILIALSAAYFGYLGSNLYLSGVENTPFELNTKISFWNFVLSGRGPGSLFMVFGAYVLITALRSGKAIDKQSKTERKNTENSDVSEGNAHIYKAMFENAAKYEPSKKEAIK